MPISDGFSLLYDKKIINRLLLTASVLSALPYPAMASADIKKEQSDTHALIQEMNTKINHQYEYISDMEHFGEKDVWQSYKDFIFSGRGDCEDFAIAKYHEVKKIDPNIDVRLAYAIHKPDISHSQAHMVAVYRINQNDKWKVLDNLTDLVLDSDQRYDLVPVYLVGNQGGHISMELTSFDWSVKENVESINSSFKVKVNSVLSESYSVNIANNETENNKYGYSYSYNNAP